MKKESGYTPLSKSKIKNFWKGVDNASFKTGRDYWIAEGRRRERRAMKRYLDTEPVSEATEFRLWLRYARPVQLRRAQKRKKRG